MNEIAGANLLKRHIDPRFKRPTEVYPYKVGVVATVLEKWQLREKRLSDEAKQLESTLSLNLLLLLLHFLTLFFNLEPLLARHTFSLLLLLRQPCRK